VIVDIQRTGPWQQTLRGATQQKRSDLKVISPLLPCTQVIFDALAQQSTPHIDHRGANCGVLDQERRVPVISRMPPPNRR
jgi:hypothetical protein